MSGPLPAGQGRGDRGRRHIRTRRPRVTSQALGDAGGAARARARRQPVARAIGDRHGATVQPAGARRTARADRALPRRVADAGADRLHLPARSGAGGAPAQPEQRPRPRRARRRRRAAAMGPERHRAHAFPVGARDDGREARLDAKARRCLPRAAGAGDGHGAGPACACAGGGQSHEQRAADGCRAGARHRDRAGATAGRLRSVLRPDVRLRQLVVGDAATLGLGAAAALLAPRLASGLGPGRRVGAADRRAAGDLAWPRPQLAQPHHRRQQHDDQQQQRHHQQRRAWLVGLDAQPRAASRRLRPALARGSTARRNALRFHHPKAASASTTAACPVPARNGR